MSAPILFLVPARGGSVRVPGKNLRPVGGIPLVARAVRVGRAAAAALPGGPHRVVCSTDDPAIAAIATTWGAEVIERPARLATSDASSVHVALHALDAVGDDAAIETLVLLQPTSPLTHPSDVVAAVERHVASGGAGVVSVSSAHPAAWHQAVASDGTLLPVDEDHDADAVLTGAFYVIAPEALRRSRRFVEPGTTIGQLVAADRSIDVDEPSDLDIAEGLLAAQPTREVAFGDRRLGVGPAFVIAEAGVNHEGDPALAHRLVDAAADAGADAVKFQTFDPDAIAAAGAPTAAYQRAAAGTGSDQRDMLRRLTLPIEAWSALQTHARERGVAFFSTPFDERSADLLERLDVPAFKVASGELTNLPFLAGLARRGRTLLVSTGMAQMSEVAAAVDTIRSSGDPPLVLFHCVSSYPAAPADANLRAIETMRRAFGVPVGWSDHTEGSETALAAVALGASLVEKHLTVDRDLPGPDHRSSLEPTAFAAMVEGVRVVEAALGNGQKTPASAERAIAEVARRSLHWGRDLAAGSLIGADDLIALRPGTGIAPGHLVDIVGRRTAGAVRAGEAIRHDDLEETR